MMRKPLKPRRNAYTWPPSCHQIFTWILLLIVNLIFYTSVIPLFTHSALPYVLGISIILLTALLTVFLIASLINPADPIWLESYNDNISIWRSFASTHKEPEMIINGHQLRYCKMCAVYVHVTSFHCSYCMKCVHNFDHHCLWMNNCVGSRNYRWFMASTILAFLASSFMSVSSLYLVVESYKSRIHGSFFSNDRNQFENQNFSPDPVISTATHGDFSVESSNFTSYSVLFIHCNADTWAWIVITNLLILAIISFLLFIMIFFHFYLKIKNISTVQFLRRRKIERIKYQSEVQDLIPANFN